MLLTRKLCVTHNDADKNRDGEVNYNDETKGYRSKIERFWRDLWSRINLDIHHRYAKICSQCGEASYSDEVAKKLEKIIDSLRSTITEVAVADYRSVA